MKILLLNCNSGISGDMLLGAFINAGIISSKKLTYTLQQAKIIPGDVKIIAKKVLRKNLPGTQIILNKDMHYTSTKQLLSIIQQSKIMHPVKSKAKKILLCLANAEKKVHKTRVAHFNQINNVDTLVDIVGSCYCLELINPGRIYSTGINIGSAAPVTLEILKNANVPVYNSGSVNELTTPTAAAILSNVVDAYIPIMNLPPPISKGLNLCYWNGAELAYMQIKKYGFGAGAMDLPDSPNLLCVLLGETLPSGSRNVSLCYRDKEQSSSYETDTVVLWETNIDDMDPRVYPYIMEKLFNAGALDVWFQNIYMKKGRPGVLLSVISSVVNEASILKLIFTQTTTLGIRREIIPRYILRRKKVRNINYGLINGKWYKKSVEYSFAIKKSKPLYTTL